MAKIWKDPHYSNQFHDHHQDRIDACIQEYRNYLRGRRGYPYAEEFPELNETEIRNCFTAARVWKSHLTDA